MLVQAHDVVDHLRWQQCCLKEDRTADAFLQKRQSSKSGGLGLLDAPTSELARSAASLPLPRAGTRDAQRSVCAGLDPEHQNNMHLPKTHHGHCLFGRLCLLADSPRKGQPEKWGCDPYDNDLVAPLHDVKRSFTYAASSAISPSKVSASSRSLGRLPTRKNSGGSVGRLLPAATLDSSGDNNAVTKDQQKYAKAIGSLLAPLPKSRLHGSEIAAGGATLTDSSSKHLQVESKTESHSRRERLDDLLAREQGRSRHVERPRPAAVRAVPRVLP